MLSQPLARWAMRRLRRDVAHPQSVQHEVLQSLVSKGKATAFGRDHDLQDGLSVAEFQARVPVRDYEGLRTYMERAVKGERDVVWPGVPLYFCKTSGTTSGAKFIPLTTDSMPNQRRR